MPSTWPDLDDPQSCRTWLTQRYSSDLATVIAHAVPDLAESINAIRNGTDTLTDRRIRSTTRSVLRYLLRATGRPTPNGAFAGVAPATFADVAELRWNDQHRTHARVDNEWLAEIITRLEQSPTLLPSLRVAMSNLIAHRGDRLQLPHGQNRVSLAITPALDLIELAAAEPITVSELVAKLAAEFPTGSADAARTMITTLIEQGVLVTHLRAPSTITDPLAHLVAALIDLPVDGETDLAALLADLCSVVDDLGRHNAAPPEQQPAIRADIVARMRLHSAAGRSPLALDVALNCSVTLPHRVGDELSRAATALLRLSPHPDGDPVWTDYHRRFTDRYGVGTLVPVTQVLNPNSGLGYPAGYPSSNLPEPMQPASPREGHLLARAYRALADSADELVLTEDDLTEIAGEASTITPPPHIELIARIRATSTAALTNGDYKLTLSPVRSVGTLSGRFSHIDPDLAELYRDLPAETTDAVRAQLTFAPIYPLSANISRVPAYLDHLISLGEHQPERSVDATPELIALGDLAVTATRDRLHLVTRQHGVIDPQVFHALALNKQASPLLRFLAQLSRGFDTVWNRLDWGPAAELPFLPRVRYRRTTIAPARWRITTTDLADDLCRDAACISLEAWRLRWRCPVTVDLYDDDRPLRLDLDVPAHVALLQDHLRRHGHAVLTEAIHADELGWIGHSHDVIVPLVTTATPAPAPDLDVAPLVTNRHGDRPAAPDARWLSISIFTHPEQMDEILSSHLPHLLANLSRPLWWFIRYRSPQETDHLRIRLHTPDALVSGLVIDSVTEWIDELSYAGVIGRATFDTYYPETGRYGGNDALDAAESVFGADSHAALHGITGLATIPPAALAAGGMVHIVRALLGDDTAAWAWLIDHKPVMQAASPAPLDRSAAEHATRLALSGPTAYPTGWTPGLNEAWQDRARALRDYAGLLPSPVPARIVESLLHMHHNRIIGPDRASEHLARRLARQAALTARAQQEAAHQ